MNCRFFRGKLSPEDRMFLVRMLGEHDAGLMLRSWVELGQVRIPGGRRLDADKAKAAEILKRRAFCRRERVLISPIDVACFAFKSRGEPKP